ncbi:MAG: 50S ribosomal protein L5 [Candidatus Hadarchaeaceae archaeon]|nr:MAG: 50S ribosomal protein L5 [Hadesarchaea archaeon DG-33]MDH5442701.1 50S ribosomal protein L5 [Hadesarchaea archaeon]MDH5685280.1 50S ribosomal protein L5 [Hadesarchaea archaeon]
MNLMREIRIEKVTLNIGVGEGGDKLAKAERVLGSITGRKPARAQAKQTIREWGVKQGEPIGCKVTLRGEEATKILKRLFDAVERRLSEKCFDGKGNFAFGVKEHIDISGVSYDPEIGIFGIDVCVTLQRPGYRIKRRRRQPKVIPKRHCIVKEEAINFITEKFGVQVV